MNPIKPHDKRKIIAGTLKTGTRNNKKPQIFRLEAFDFFRVAEAGLKSNRLEKSIRLLSTII
jgi:hypothetical protein